MREVATPLLLLLLLLFNDPPLRLLRLLRLRLLLLRLRLLLLLLLLLLRLLPPLGGVPLRRGRAWGGRSRCPRRLGRPGALACRACRVRRAASDLCVSPR